MSATDAQQVAYCLSAGRVFFTQDRDFLRLHAAAVGHAGIAYCEKDTKTIGEMIQGLILIWEILEPDEMVNRVEFL